jgi:hypothetical protein
MPRPDPPAATDVLCEQCGYTLNGLPETAACPECGLPVAASTTASIRRPPSWELGGRGAAQTIWRVLFSPRRFFRTLDMQPSNRKSRAFSFIFLGIASLISVQTMGLHYVLMFTLQAAPDWLPATAWLALPLLLAIALTMHGLLELISLIAAAEGRWWGYRLKRPVVRRAMQYLTPHMAMIVNLPYLVVVGFFIAIALRRDLGLYVTQYLFVLSGAVVVAAVYLFRIFMYAMRGIVYTNPPGADPMKAAFASIADLSHGH